VRHPLSWYASYWNWKNNIFGWTSSNELDDVCRDNDFIGFINKVLDKYDNGYVSGMFGMFTEHCHRIGKVENLERDLESILREFGEPFKKHTLKREPSNAGASWGYKEIKYTKELADKVMAMENVVVNKFGYDYMIKDLVSI
jgi:hypothetical protein